MEKRAIETPDSVEHFWKKLRQWQVSHGLLQKEAANLLGVNIWTYKGWWRGKHAPNSFVRDVIESRMKTTSCPPGKLPQLNPKLLE